MSSGRKKAGDRIDILQRLVDYHEIVRRLRVVADSCARHAAAEDAGLVPLVKEHATARFLMGRAFLGYRSAYKRIYAARRTPDAQGHLTSASSDRPRNLL